MYGIMIGRFQPLHLGHCHIINQIIKTGHNPVIVIGSANKERDLAKNPYNYTTRKEMVNAIYPKITQFIPMNDCNSMEKWYNSLINKMKLMGLNKKNTVIHYSRKPIDCQDFIFEKIKYKDTHYCDVFEYQGWKTFQYDLLYDKNGRIISASNIRKNNMKKYSILSEN